MSNKIRPDIKTLDDLYPRLWLHPNDLDGKTHTVTIEKIEVREFWDEHEQANKPKIVLYFHKRQRFLICNKMQSEAMSEITGTLVIGEWIAHTIRIYPGVARNKKPTILISAALPTPKAAPSPNKAAPPETVTPPAELPPA